jgi:hypothetical protein
MRLAPDYPLEEDYCIGGSSGVGPVCHDTESCLQLESPFPTCPRRFDFFRLIPQLLVILGVSLRRYMQLQTDSYPKFLLELNLDNKRATAAIN